MGEAYATIHDFRDFYKGRRVVIAGCGRSILGVPQPLSVPVIGVNDVTRYVVPDCLVVMDKVRKFTPERRYWIEACPGVVFVGQNAPEWHDTIERTVPFVHTKHKSKLALPSEKGVMSHFKDSPYVAFQLGIWMGASEIGFIGVDHTGDHPKLWRLRGPICTMYGRVAEMAPGLRCVKLSERSELPFDYVPYEEWVA